MKQLIKIGDREFIADVVYIEVKGKLVDTIINNASVDELNSLMRTQIDCEYYEGASAIKKRLEKLDEQSLKTNIP